jgi:hypothetical protein
VGLSRALFGDHARPTNENSVPSITSRPVSVGWHAISKADHNCHYPGICCRVKESRAMGLVDGGPRGAIEIATFVAQRRPRL